MRNNQSHLNTISLIALRDSFARFLRLESFSGILLFLCAILAMVVANSPLKDMYFHLWHTMVGFSIDGDFYGFSLHHWINDVAMSLFFLMVGLEIKREIAYGDLSGFSKASFPVIGALGGMIVPGITYYMLNINTPSEHGFGIPMATDIAFALGVILLLKNSVPTALKVFLVTLAVADDLGAIVVIALFYPTGDGLSMSYLLASGGVLVVLIALNKFGVRSLLVYLLIGILLWFFVHFSGVHATIAAVALAFCIPIAPKSDSSRFATLLSSMSNAFKSANQTNVLLESKQMKIINILAKESALVQNPLLRLEHALSPICAYVIMPLFAFANAGVSLDAGSVDFHIDHILWGVILGLVVGKPLGILALTFIAEKLHIARRPLGVSWAHILGAGMLGGIGFTMSIFVSNLAFDNVESMNVAKVAILMASVLAGVIGSVYLIVLDKFSSKFKKTS